MPQLLSFLPVSFLLQWHPPDCIAQTQFVLSKFRWQFCVQDKFLDNFWQFRSWLFLFQKYIWFNTQNFFLYSHHYNSCFWILTLHKDRNFQNNLNDAGFLEEFLFMEKLSLSFLYFLWNEDNSILYESWDVQPTFDTLINQV